jgi:uncharacterized LabA/DUF88 family protein
MSTSSRLFIDFWNFSLNWRQRMGGQRCDWKKLPSEIVGQANLLFDEAGLSSDLALDETLVYVSLAKDDHNLKNWLDGFLDRVPSFRVIRKERERQPTKIHCRNCDTEVSSCANCGAPYTRAAEKGIDAQIVTDLLSLAWQNAYDVAILLTSDADFVPTVIRVQEKGLKVINVSWKYHGHELRKACWASFELDTVAPNILRSAVPPSPVPPQVP